ncbi:hypothetical protein BRLA_c017770 [Brevibacillus laterosporus LMG 15441]|uniref:Uncharacterized protein n=1 Tax=Brevibacillus laterosporus LMG 15441 TaxID=1042163 RepID=A0A075R958_BRELA|nr:hypothetical protein BRLA_c017770 [Brevibacillus laterosporus LMG 15441]
MKSYYDSLIAERYNEAASFIGSDKPKEILSRQLQTQMSKANSRIMSYKVRNITPLKNNLYKAYIPLLSLQAKIIKEIFSYSTSYIKKTHNKKILCVTWCFHRS